MNSGDSTVPESPGESFRRKALTPLLFLLLLLVAYSVSHVVFIKTVVDGETVFTTDGDEVQYLVVTESIITDHDLSPLNNYLDNCYQKHGYYEGSIPYPALVAGTGGRLVYSHMPLMSVLVMPGFWLFGYHGAAATMIMLMSLAGMLCFLVLRMLIKEETALVVTAAFFLTYPLMIYSRLIYPSTVAVFLLLLGLWATLRIKRGGGWVYALTAGLAAGLLFQFHVKYGMITLALLFLLFCCSSHRKRDFAAWGVPVVLSGIVLIVFTIWMYGPNLYHGLTISTGPGGFFAANYFWGIFGLYLDRAWGLFIFAPLYFLFLPGVLRKKNLTSWWLFIPICIILHTLMVGLFGKWDGGVSPVPRQLVPIMGLLVICAGVFYQECRSLVVKAAIGILLVFQVILTVFALRNPLATFAIHGPNNALIPEILGVNWLSKTVVRAFPLFHPTTFKMVVLLAGWIIVLGAISYYLRKRAIDPIYPGLDWGECK